MDVLRPDLIERARKMTRARSNNHPWLSMDDEELLRSAGLILLDHESRREGITLAAILLLGKGTTIMSALPQHKTDMIFRVQNLDRYDDRDVIVTNLLDSYDRMSEFAKKHLNDPFVLDGMQSVSARDAILREIGLADELGSGMRNTYKFTKLYSGGIPQFVEGDVFKTVIPLNETATMKSGPKASDQVRDIVVEKILEFCKVARTKKEISEHIGYKNLTYMTRTYIKPLLERGKLVYTIPEKPQSRLQKYVTKQ